MKEAYLNDLETELWLLFANHDKIQNLRFRNGACYGDVTEDIKVKIHFLPMGKPDTYQGLRIDTTSRTMGKLGASCFLFRGLIGRAGASPYLQIKDGKADWVPERPTPMEYAAIRKLAFDILDTFREPLPEIPRPASRQKRNTKSRDRAR